MRDVLLRVLCNFAYERLTAGILALCQAEFLLRGNFVMRKFHRLALPPTGNFAVKKFRHWEFLLRPNLTALNFRRAEVSPLGTYFHI